MSRNMHFFAMNKLIYALKNDFVQKILMYFIGGILIIQGKLTVGVLLMFMGYISSLNSYADNIMNSITEFAEEKAVYERLYDILSCDTMVHDDITLADNSIVINNLDYKYPNSEFDIFKNAEYVFSPYRKYLIFGESGIGKSTLVKLLLKEIEPLNGSIQLGNKSISAIRDSKYYERFGFVMQNENFFNFSIIDNLKLINPNATEKEIFEACEIAEIHKFITMLPDGYNTIIGERGIKLSGGQRQRLAIARMILHKPDIIVMDEATNSIDVATENKIFQNLENNFNNKTWIVVTHNSNIAVVFDDVIEVKNARLCRK